MSSKPTTTASLFEPMQLGPLTLRNRIFMAPLTRDRCVPDNAPNNLNAEYYRQRAQSAGLIVSEAILVSQQIAEWPQMPGIWNNKQVAGWKRVVDAVHEEGAPIYAQLIHFGRTSYPDEPEQNIFGLPVYAPSARAARGGKFRFIDGQPGHVTPTAIDHPETQLDLFEQAAINAKQAGFDGVELHAAGGYLVHQFLDTNSNQRTDIWGGSVANRSRFGIQALERLIKVYGKDRVGIKLSPCGGFNDVGMPMKETIETFTHFISEIDKLGIAYVHLMRYIKADWIVEGKEREAPHDVLSTYGDLVKNAKLFSNGGYTAEEAAQAIEDGRVAGVLFGLPWIAHPDFAKRIKYGKSLDNQLDSNTLYGKYKASQEERRKGYVDYPAAVY